MLKNIMIVLFFVSILAFSTLSLSGEINGKDAHIQATCPAAAAWKDEHKTGNSKFCVMDVPSPVPTMPKLREELKIMTGHDQKARSEWQDVGFSVKSKAFSQVTEVDAENLSKFKTIFSKTGFQHIKRLALMV